MPRFEQNEAAALPAAIEAHDGRRRLGVVHVRGCQAVAELADSTDLGEFPNRESATTAVIAASRLPFDGGNSA